MDSESFINYKNPDDGELAWWEGIGQKWQKNPQRMKFVIDVQTKHRLKLKK